MFSFSFAFNQKLSFWQKVRAIARWPRHLWQLRRYK
jgi:hypothetical protein